ncbi:hypothetical protein [Streptomyces sp. 8N706]|uniref:hypothetical protein n=1 Tax=Streptomyces sp. 8N706 TaxID=3457416 RepID=UPI003FD6AC02
MLDAARNAVEYKKIWPWRPGSTFLHWWAGGSVDRAQANVHEAELLLLQLVPAEELAWRGPVILARGIQHLGGKDPRLRILEAHLRQNNNVLAPNFKDLALSVLHAANHVEESEIARVRSFRNVLLATFVATSVITVLFILSGYHDPDALADKLCFDPPSPTEADPQHREHVCPVGMPRNGDDEAQGADVLLVASLGMTAATLTGAASVRKIQGTATPYMVPVGLLLLRLPIGALSALLGLILIHGEFVPGLSALDSSAQIVAWAVAFGIGQEGLTRLIDKQGDKVLENVRGPSRGFDEPPAKPEPLRSTIPKPGGPGGPGPPAGPQPPSAGPEPTSGEPQPPSTEPQPPSDGRTRRSRRRSMRLSKRARR